MVTNTLTSAIKRQANELGFSHVGIARAERLEVEGGRLAAWLREGHQASMDWMARSFEKRIDPRAILPDAKSIVAVALNYYTPYDQSENPQFGKISRYAWGDDYHTIMRDRLEQLVAFIKQTKPNAEARSYVDTGPMMDKVWAQRSGNGWIGKHTNVITKDYGSWVFLGEVILNIELEYDPPATDHCGSCTRCIDACPTQAIIEPYILNSNLCISYMTIEQRGEIEDGIAGKLDGWIYGCDVCQDVCPWNRKFARPTTESSFAPRSDASRPMLSEWAEMTPEEFNTKFRASPIKRTKYAGLMRNIELVIRARSSVA